MAMKFSRLPLFIVFLVYLAWSSIAVHRTAHAAAEPVHARPIVTLTILSQADSKQTLVPVTFGQVFKPGDVPRSTTLAAQLDGKPQDIQVDPKAMHKDGTLRHAIITFMLPNIGAHSRRTLALLRGQPQERDTETVTLPAVLASAFDAKASVREESTIYTADAADALARTSPQSWLSGDIVSEWLAVIPFKDARGKPHPRLEARFHVRAYQGLKNVRVDVVIENTKTFAPPPSTVIYDADIMIGGAKAYTVKTLRHYPRARWHGQFWWGKEPALYVAHDKAYLQSTGAIPTYADLQPSDKYLDGMLKKFTPMDNGDLTRVMSNTGAQSAIGPLPRWTSAYVVSIDPRAYRSMLANDDSGGSYGAHYRDEKTGLPVSIADRPQATLNGPSEPDISDALDGNPNKHDQAHQPSIGYVSYLVTGDFYYLEEMHFWVSWNQLWSNATTTRQYEKGIYAQQVRGQAWALRTHGQAAYITPDKHPYKAHLLASLKANLEYNDSMYAKNPKANALGVIAQKNPTDARPWMDDFYTFVMGYLVDLGFTEAQAMRDWKAKFVLGRLGINTRYCWRLAATYRASYGPNEYYPSFNAYWLGNWGNKIAGGKKLDDLVCESAETTQWLNDYAEEFGKRSRKHTVKDDKAMSGEGRPWSPDSYYANMQPAVAAVVDSGLPGVDTAYQRFFVMPAVKPDYNDEPQWAVVPKSLPTQ